MLTNRHTSILLLLCTVGLLFLSGIAASKGKDDTHRVNLGKAGHLETNDPWVVSTDENGTAFLECITTVSCYGMAEILNPETCNNVKNCLMALAEKEGLQPWYRPVDGKLLDEANADVGGFILGTVQQNEDYIPGETEVDSLRSGAIYKVVIVYQKKKNFYMLKAWTTDLPGGSNVLNRLQRSWRL